MGWWKSLEMLAEASAKPRRLWTEFMGTSAGSVGRGRPAWAQDCGNRTLCSLDTLLDAKLELAHATSGRGFVHPTPPHIHTFHVDAWTNPGPETIEDMPCPTPPSVSASWLTRSEHLPLYSLLSSVLKPHVYTDSQESMD